MIKIYSIHYNKPDYIDFQYVSIKKYCKVDFELIILDNSIDHKIKHQIKKKCEDYKIKCINCANIIQSQSSESHQNALSRIVDIVNIGDTFMIIDHDVFFVGFFDESYYSNYDIIALDQIRGHVNYPWPGLIIFNNLKTKNKLSFKSLIIESERCDTGGEMYFYIKENKVNYKKIGLEYLGEGPNLMSLHDNTFLHLIAGSDWNSYYDTDSKINQIFDMGIFYKKNEL